MGAGPRDAETQIALRSNSSHSQTGARDGIGNSGTVSSSASALTTCESCPRDRVRETHGGLQLRHATASWATDVARTATSVYRPQYSQVRRYLLTIDIGSSF